MRQALGMVNLSKEERAPLKRVVLMALAAYKAHTTDRSEISDVTRGAYALASLVRLESPADEA